MKRKRYEIAVWVVIAYNLKLNVFLKIRENYRVERKTCPQSTIDKICILL